MKDLVILLLIAVLIACSTTRDSQVSLNNRETTSLYQIQKIKNENSFYIIYAVRNDSIFKIVSNIDNINSFNCEKIKAGNSYILNIKVLFPSDTLFGKPVAPNLGIRGYSINNGKVVMLENESHNKIYTALNLNGLCINK